MKLYFILHGYHTDYLYDREENFIYPWKLITGELIPVYFKTYELIFEPKPAGTNNSPKHISSWSDYILKKL